MRSERPGSSSRKVATLFLEETVRRVVEGQSAGDRSTDRPRSFKDLGPVEAVDVAAA
jgi:hypothetical protein